jgi:predicted O-linked N-acetylglucosamine transferase (SPINDLY family)
LKQRSSETACNNARYVVVIPWQPRAAFHGLMKRADVYLDTIGFSGSTPAMQAVGSGLPIVTREGRFMRGRLASGLLKQIGLSELVAQSEEEYVATAARLVRDAEYGRRIRARIEGARASSREDIRPDQGARGFSTQPSESRKAALTSIFYFGRSTFFSICSEMRYSG